MAQSKNRAETIETKLKDLADESSTRIAALQAEHLNQADRLWGAENEIKEPAKQKLETEVRLYKEQLQSAMSNWKLGKTKRAWESLEGTAWNLRGWEYDYLCSLFLANEIGKHSDDVNCVAFSIDGKRIVSGGDDTLVRIWDTTSGEIIHQLDGHKSRVTTAFFFGNDDEFILSGSQKRKGVVWNSHTGEELFSIRGLVQLGQRL